MIVFDLDGTLCDIEHRRHLVTKPRADWEAFYKACLLDSPKHAMLDLLHMVALGAGREVQIWSGRSELVREETLAWFNKFAPWVVKVKIPIRMRPLKDTTPDDVLKERWLDEELARGIVITAAVDDRNKVVAMWRRRGIVCLQCALGDF